MMFPIEDIISIPKVILISHFSGKCIRCFGRNLRYEYFCFQRKLKLYSKISNARLGMTGYILFSMHRKERQGGLYI